MLAGFLYAIVDPPPMPRTPWTGGDAPRSPVAAGPTAPSLMPKNVPRPGTSGPAPRPRPSVTATPTPPVTQAPTSAAPTSADTKVRHGNPTHTPPGQAKKAKSA